ncbi:uncharacterized protein LOC141591452 isoform X10 [Silene latifolia]
MQIGQKLGGNLARGGTPKSARYSGMPGLCVELSLAHHPGRALWYLWSRRSTAGHEHEDAAATIEQAFNAHALYCVPWHDTLGGVVWKGVWRICKSLK